MVNTELSLKVKRVMLMIFSIDFVWYKCNTFILRCFLQFTCTNLDGCQKEGVNFKNLFQKEGGTQKGVGFPQKRGGSNPEGNHDALYSYIKLSTIVRSFKPIMCHLLGRLFSNSALSYR